MSKKIWFCQDCGAEVEDGISVHECEPDFMFEDCLPPAVNFNTAPFFDLTGEPDPVFDAIKEYERLRPTLQ